jgi:hypothetical protein
MLLMFHREAARLKWVRCGMRGLATGLVVRRSEERAQEASPGLKTKNTL